MAIKIFKSGLTINSIPYEGLYIELNPLIEVHYNRVSIKTKCYPLEDASTWNIISSSIVPQGWERFDPIKVDFEPEASTNLEEWAHTKTLEELVSKKKIPYEYMKYEDDVYKLDPLTGDPVLDPCTNEPVIIHPKGELIKKENGTYRFYTKILPSFCDPEDVSIHI